MDLDGDIVDKDSKVLFRAARGRMYRRPYERDANAWLAAAAPELLIACKIARACLVRPDFGGLDAEKSEVVRILDAAIQRARG